MICNRKAYLWRAARERSFYNRRRRRRVPGMTWPPNSFTVRCHQGRQRAGRFLKMPGADFLLEKNNWTQPLCGNNALIMRGSKLQTSSKRLTWDLVKTSAHLWTKSEINQNRWQKNTFKYLPVVGMGIAPVVFLIDDSIWFVKSLDFWPIVRYKL